MAELVGEAAEVVEGAGEEVVERAASRRLRFVDSLSEDVDLSLTFSLVVCGRYSVRIWQWSGGRVAITEVISTVQRDQVASCEASCASCAAAGDGL